MKKILLLLAIIPSVTRSQTFSPEELNVWKTEAKRVTIVRDSWGIPHVYGRTDADAVFGLLYAECEENFPRVERNYLEMLGRLSEIDGAAYLPSDLQMKVIYDTTEAQKDYAAAPDWLRKLLDAFADGVNFYLATHPQTHPLLLNRFKAWYPLLFTDGSISATQTGGLKESDVRSLYFPGFRDGLSFRQLRQESDGDALSGSNGFAIAPSRTATGHAMLYINPHVSFYFRTEVQVVSEEGLNAYGAVTWGQFFVYQGFNAHCGWMHTSSEADVADLYREKLVKKGDSLYYEYENAERPVRSRDLVLTYKSTAGQKEFPVKVFYTHHGPVLGSRDGQWMSLREHNRSMIALMQSWLRTKADSFEEFRKIMDMRSNNSNNTVYADDKGNIAYWHGNFMPLRDTVYDWTRPVDGSVSATEWKGLHSLDEMIHIYNPASGWIQNCNSTPFEASGPASPRREHFPSYMAPDGQNARALNAIRLISSERQFTIEKLIRAGFDHYLSAFGILLPSLLRAYDALPTSDTMRLTLAEPIRLLRSWDLHSAENSIPTTLAIFWGTRLIRRGSALAPGPRTSDQVQMLRRLAEQLPPAEKLNSMAAAIKDLQTAYGTWKIEWGMINRFQRTAGMTSQTFDDAQPSWPVGMTSSRWGSLPAFESRIFPQTKKMYGHSGNSFIAAVEFGNRIHARTVVTGGQSFDISSPHSADQAERFIQGDLKEAFFYKEDVYRHAAHIYHPGE
jgi:acyl-homoserine lactone acylase PvdQ